MCCIKTLKPGVQTAVASSPPARSGPREAALQAQPPQAGWEQAVSAPAGTSARQPCFLIPEPSAATHHSRPEHTI